MAVGKKRVVANLRLAAFAGSAMISLMGASSVFAADVNFKISPQRLQSALFEYSEQAGVQLIIAADTKGLRLRRAVRGTMDIEAALAELIQGTDLEFHFTSSDTVTIRNRQLPPSVKAASGIVPEAQENGSAAPYQIEEIVSVGTRGQGRSATETPVPVDVMTSTDLSRTGHTELGRMLQALAPSFNFSSSSVSDGTDALRPATLRGLGPDQTLVLVNGKRRHTSALVHVNTSVGRGATGVDMNAIPAAALGGVEVLRDGAAAQYGSDAIAGVINLKLSEDEGFELTSSYGQTYMGDGETLQLSGVAGVGIGEEGFITLAVDYRNREDTNRAGLTGEVQYPVPKIGSCSATVNIGCDPREFGFDRMNFRIGDADSEQVAFVVNAELPISDTVALYSFATYSDRKNQSAGFYRRANQYDRTVASIYPDGFLPLINTNIEDYSLTSGVFIDMGSFQFDLSGSYGANSFNFYISNSLNASLGESSPTEADAGTLEVSQTILTIDAVKSLELAGREASFAFGAEYRQEGYKLIAGEPASYIDGGAVNTACPGCEIEPVRYQSGFQVFRGFSPQNEVDADRQNTAFYLDLEVEPSDNWLVASAVRYEDYSDFGSKLTGKISSRYRVSDGLSFRGSLSTGFRAPSIQQINFNSVSTQFVEIGGETVAQERGTFQHDSLVAHLVGLPELKEETSFNASAGFVATGNGFTLTADYYHVEIDDRIGISGAINLTQPTFSNVSVSASSAQFFVNAADTKTDGLDLVASYKVPMPEGQALLFNAAANWTRTKVVDESVATTIGGVDVGPLITAQDISIIEDWQPKSRINFGVQYSVSNWDFTSRLSRYGSYTVCEGACDTMENTQTFSAKWLADVQVSYRFPVNGLSVSIGVNNLFDTTPDKNLIGQARGGEILGIVSSPGVFQYSRRSAPFGFNGGYWYARASMRF